MRRHLLQSLLLRLASLVVPTDRRQDWLEEWHSELWYMCSDVALRACLGAFSDAAWLRKNAETPHRSLFHTAYGCLAVLFALGIAGLLAANWLLAPLGARATLWRLTARDLLPANILMLAVSLVLLPLASQFGPRPGFERRLPKEGRARRVLFFAAKLMAVQPILLCGLFLCVMTAPIIPFAPFGVVASWYLVLRWLVADQRRRCPQCLRLLDRPVRIGTRSSTFLGCDVAESACPEAHGVLHRPETELSYPATEGWLALDPSWNALFCTKPRGRRL